MVTKDDLWTYLGFVAKQKLPFFQEFTDPDAVIEPWTEEGECWLADQGSTCEPLWPHWHQLVGVFCMLQCSFEGTPMLLMDEGPLHGLHFVDHLLVVVSLNDCEVLAYECEI